MTKKHEILKTIRDIIFWIVLSIASGISISALAKTIEMGFFICPMSLIILIVILEIVDIICFIGTVFMVIDKIIHLYHIIKN